MKKLIVLFTMILMLGSCTKEVEIGQSCRELRQQISEYYAPLLEPLIDPAIPFADKDWATINRLLLERKEAMASVGCPIDN
jgi:hypothetical protein